MRKASPGEAFISNGYPYYINSELLNFVIKVILGFYKPSYTQIFPLFISLMMKSEKTDLYKAIFSFFISGNRFNDFVA